MVHGIPVHRRLEQEDCKFEASLKKITLLFFREDFVLYVAWVSSAYVQLPSGGQKRMWDPMELESQAV